MTGYSTIAADRHRKIRLLDADDVAAQLLEQARERPCRMALFVTPDGDFLAAQHDSERYGHLLAKFEHSLVGIYSGDAMKVDVLEDIWARCEQIGMEWPK